MQVRILGALLCLFMSSLAGADHIDESTVRIGDVDVPVGATSMTRIPKSRDVTFQISPNFQINKLAVDFARSQAVKNDIAQYEASESALANISDEELQSFHEKLANSIGGDWYNTEIKLYEWEGCDYKFRYNKTENKLIVLDSNEVELAALANLEQAFCVGTYLAVTVINERIKTAHLFVNGDSSETSELPYGLSKVHTRPLNLGGSDFFGVFNEEYVDDFSKVRHGESFTKLKLHYLLSPDGQSLGTPRTRPCQGLTVMEINEADSGNKKFAVMNGEGRYLVSSERFIETICDYENRLVLFLVDGEIELAEDLRLGSESPMIVSEDRVNPDFGPTLIGFRSNHEIFALLPSWENVTFRGMDFAPSGNPLRYRLQYQDSDSAVHHIDFSQEIMQDSKEDMEVAGCEGWKLAARPSEGQSGSLFLNEKHVLNFSELAAIACSQDSKNMAFIAKSFHFDGQEIVESSRGKLALVALDENGQSIGQMFLQKNSVANDSFLSHVKGSTWRLTRRNENKVVNVEVYDVANQRFFSGALGGEVSEARETMLHFREILAKGPEKLSARRFRPDLVLDFDFKSGDGTVNVFDQVTGKNVRGTLSQEDLELLFALGETAEMSELEDIAKADFYPPSLVGWNQEAKMGQIDPDNLWPNSETTLSAASLAPFSKVFMKWMKVSKNERHWVGVRLRRYKSKVSDHVTHVGHVYDVLENFKNGQISDRKVVERYWFPEFN